MALFDRDQLASSLDPLALFGGADPGASRSPALAVSRRSAQPPALARESKQAIWWIDEGGAWVVFDIDGTREAARQRALPQTEELPAAFRRLDEVCAPGYTGRKRGEVVRTRTVVSQAHSYQWLGSFGNRGNGLYREELRQALAAIGRYLATHQLPQEHALLRLDGQYGTGAVLADLTGFSFVMRGKDYTVLDHPLVQTRLHLPPDQLQHRPESQLVRSLYDCPRCLWGLRGAVPCGGGDPSSWHTEEPGWRYAFGRRLRTLLHQLAAAGIHRRDVVELYLHRGAFEPALADEDVRRTRPDRWCSHSAWGQECWQIVSQWVWNLRLELGHQLNLPPCAPPSLPLPSRLSKS